jgi:hypothetical protein
LLTLFSLLASGFWFSGDTRKSVEYYAVDRFSGPENGGGKQMGDQQ